MKRDLRPSTVAFPSHTSERGLLQRTMSQTVPGSMTFSSNYGMPGGPAGSNLQGHANISGFRGIAEGSNDMEKIKKVQSFFRGWLCRRRWKQIVEQYIKSPHAESMRKRNRWCFLLYLSTCFIFFFTNFLYFTMEINRLLNYLKMFILLYFSFNLILVFYQT